MVGVASPMLVRTPWKGIRFILAMTVGTFTAAAVVAVAVSLVSIALSHFGSGHQRMWVAAALVAMLGILDVLDKTPHVKRQTPKLLFDVMPSSLFVGMVWGFDIGLLVTTVKKTSLLWAGLILATIQGQAAVLMTVLLYSATWLLGQYLMTSSAALGRNGARGFFWMQKIGASQVVFRAAGVSMLVAAVFLVVGQ